MLTVSPPCPTTSLNRRVDSNEPAAVVEDSLKLHPLDHVGHSVHHVGAREDVSGQRHYLFDGLASPSTIERGGRYHRHGLRMIEFESLLFSLQRHVGHHVDEQFVELSRRQVHRHSPSGTSRLSAPNPRAKTSHSGQALRTL